MTSFFRRYGRDLAVVGGLLLLALAAWGVLTLCGRGGDTVVVRIDGAVAARYPLSADGEYPFRTDRGYNLLVIEDGRARVAEADCLDKICVSSRAVSRVGETIVCLPHRLTVTVEGDGAPAVDIG